MDVDSHSFVVELTFSGFTWRGSYRTGNGWQCRLSCAQYQGRVRSSNT